ncbi:uncharacterized protein LOC119265448 [Pygocentrus nattereri]|uniref:uncharacterized protein LOC119265448 n=1 Tax=Pygocentrus nattereri TaxID=42514 RepID=UPI001891979A|nr:uncharacterized protein LOC119265448 [Pygocentrus nattereri]
MPQEILQSWHAYYTRYSASEKGVAILVKRTERFILKSQEIDRNGRYVIVQCNLRGQDYTLVSVYNHQEDTTTLDLLIPYLQRMTVGTLVIGGDFNTTFSKNDRAKRILSSNEFVNPQLLPIDQPNRQHVKLRKCVERLMRHLQLVDVFRRKHGYARNDDACFTFMRCDRTAQNFEEFQDTIIKSRLDYFFIPEEWMCSVKKCEVVNVFEYPGRAVRPLTEQGRQPATRSDHSPLLLQLDLNSPVIRHIEIKESSNLHAPQQVNDSEHISGVEIVAAIQSVQLRDINRPGVYPFVYKNFNDEVIKILKDNYTNQISNALPRDFNSATVTADGYYFFNVDYLILATILAWRIEDWGGESETQIEDGPQTVQWLHLHNCLLVKLEGHPAFSDFAILEQMLKENENNEKMLCEGCPLTHILRKCILEYQTIQRIG